MLSYFVKRVRELSRATTAKKRPKKRDARAQLLFCWYKPITFFWFSLASPASLLELPIVAIQKFCYHGNVTSHFSSPQEMSTRRLLHVRIHCVWIFLFQSQGQENDIILVSLVRSSKEGGIGYLASMDRLCVAISRARCGLYLFGNHVHLSQKFKKGWKVCNRDYLRYTVPAHGSV